MVSTNRAAPLDQNPSTFLKSAVIERDFDAILRSLIRLAQTCTPTESTASAPSLLCNLYARSGFTCTFREASSDLKKKNPFPRRRCARRWTNRREAGIALRAAQRAESEMDSSGSSCGSPQHRLLSCEGGAHDPDNEGKMRFFPSADGRADDDAAALSFDSHISGVDDPKEYAQKSRDCKPNRKFLKRIASWAEGISLPRGVAAER
ncbi:hypothetical protein C8J57DRAFT_259504 [Mycena rebaudengoi]|nr:hypothetical protein C8J57DRAFT_259504 [Mycena rebaudengoi]